MGIAAIFDVAVDGFIYPNLTIRVREDEAEQALAQANRGLLGRMKAEVTIAIDWV